ncbi:MAG: hypothetical protein EPN36_14040 [Rhodanobacteraceae bacterium]|nr:MAG: hypothetical protein EPN36_14040 [Rhodanobacteraceae bacterium]
MKTPNVQNSRYEGRIGNKVGLECTLDGARYHVWLDAETLKLVEENRISHRYQFVLYRNPLRGVQPQDPAYFSTQFLSATSNHGAAIVAAMRKQADANGGIMRLQLIEEAEKKAERAQAERDRLARATCEVAPELYGTLKQIVIECTESPSCDAVRIETILSYARTALAKVDAS